MFLDYAERMAEKRTGSYKMEDWAKRLDMFLNFNEYPILENSGKVSHEVANVLRRQNIVSSVLYKIESISQTLTS